MANTNRARGFECKGSPLRVNRYVSGAACYPGDLVTCASTGKVNPATAGSLVLGVCLSYASAADVEILVADHPDQLIVGQVAAAEIDAQTDFFNTADITATGGSSTYKMSRQVVDGSSQSASAAKALRLLDYTRRPYNDLGSYVEVICSINLHQFGPAAANAGVGL